MLRADNSPTPDTQIQMESLSIDKMRLTVTNIYPAFQNKQRLSGSASHPYVKSEQEIRQEIETLLYQIFKKYA
ncbi:MAG: hypothetical protein K2O16_06820 [Lachnospiraceae bacterium]|nr:hypothetical protein [Lachnospiraceae bacterium]